MSMSDWKKFGSLWGYYDQIIVIIVVGLLVASFFFKICFPGCGDLRLKLYL